MKGSSEWYTLHISCNASEKGLDAKMNTIQISSKASKKGGGGALQNNEMYHEEKKHNNSFERM